MLTPSPTGFAHRSGDCASDNISVLCQQGLNVSSLLVSVRRQFASTDPCAWHKTVLGRAALTAKGFVEWITMWEWSESVTLQLSPGSSRGIDSSCGYCPVNVYFGVVRRYAITYVVVTVILPYSNPSIFVNTNSILLDTYPGS